MPSNMTSENHQNFLYFESVSMKGLHKELENWQATSKKGILSMSIHRDRELFCCIAITSPIGFTNNNAIIYGNSASVYQCKNACINIYNKIPCLDE